MTLVFDRMQIMDWIRRNFPDLLIGLALVVVIGAIIATLLSGGSLFPGGKRNTVADILPSSGSSTTLPVTSTTTSTTTPTNTGSIAVPVTTDTNTIDTNTTTIPQAPIATATGAATNAATNAANSAVAAANALTDVTPLNPSALPVVVVGGNNETSNTANTTAVSNTVVNTNTATTVAASGNNAPYRVSVGAFGNAANANKRVETFKARGYPAFSAKQGSLTLVLVGPYDTQSQANKVAQDIKSSGLEPAANVIKFNPNAAASSASSTANTAPAASTSAIASASSSNALTAPPVAVSGNYLQVGAYRTNATAQPLKDKLAKLGFSPQNLEDNNFIKVIIGPFDANGLKTAQAILKANNLDSFVR